MMIQKFMTRFAGYFMIPVAIIIMFLEISLRQIPNDYSYKNEWLSENSRDLKILSLGPSNGYFGIDPNYFQQKAFNAAHISQSINYDLFIFDKFLPLFDSLKYVIIPVSQLTPYYSLENSDEYWRIKNYTIFYECKYHRYQPEFNSEFFGNNLISVVPRIKGYYSGGISELYCNELGFGLNYSFGKRKTDWENTGFSDAKHQKSNISKELYNQNLGCLNRIIEECNNRDISVILIAIPAWHTFVKNIDTRLLESTDAIYIHLAELNRNVRYINLLNDKRFVADDFYDADHLDEIGAKKLTLILNDTLNAK